MTAITDLSDLVDLAVGSTVNSEFFYKDSRIGITSSAAASASVTSRLHSLWQYNGCPSGEPTAPSLSNPDNTTNGALPIIDATGGKTKWCLGVTAAPLNAGTLIVYDRLVHGSGLSGTDVSPQAYSQSVSRYTTTESVGNQLFVEIYTIIGATARTATIDYYNQANSPKTTPAFVIGGTGFREAQRIIPVPLAIGDTGVRSVDSITLSASTGTVGDFGIIIGRPLVIVPIGLAGTGTSRDLIAGLPGIIEIKAGACISFMWLANSNFAPQIYGSFHTVDK